MDICRGEEEKSATWMRCRHVSGGGWQARAQQSKIKIEERRVHELASEP